MVGSSPSVTPRRAAGLPGSFIGVSIPSSSSSSRPKPSQLPASASRPNEGHSRKQSQSHASPSTVGSSVPSSASSASATADTTASSSHAAAALQRVIKTPKSATRVPQVVIPSLPKKMSSTPAKAPAPPALEDEEDELTSLSDDEMEVVVVPKKTHKKTKSTDVLGDKPANVKKPKKATGEDGAPAKPKKRKAKDEGEGDEAKAGPSKKKAKKAAAGEDGKVDDADAPKKPRPPPGSGSIHRCHQCRQEYPGNPEKVIRCANVKVKPMPKGERDAKGIKQSEAPAVSERCRMAFCGKCLMVRYGENMEAIKVDASFDGYDWKCPCCVGDCNCSACRKRRGEAPTGVINLKEVNATSVRELLARDPKARGKNAGTTPVKKPPKEPKEPKAAKPKTSAAANGKEPAKKRKKVEKPRPTDGNVSDASSDLSSVPSSDLSSVPLTTSEDTSLVSSKKQIRRSPRTVLAPKLVINLVTAGLASSQILLRLHVREFIIRFRHLLPGLGKTPQTKAEAERSVEAMMDDVAGFWDEDEGGMRALVAGLIGVIEKDEVKYPGLVLAKREPGFEAFATIKKELKTGVTGAHHTQGATQCWESCQKLLETEGFGSQIEADAADAYIDQSDEMLEARRSKRKILPEFKVAIVAAFIELALRCETIRDDMVQGVERERQTKLDIVKNRAKVNKQFAELKAKMGAEKPSTDSLFEPGKSPSKQSVKVKAAEAERLAALEEWQDEMREKDQEHKSQLRMFGISNYLAGTQHIRFESIGSDTRGNKYYILADTPGRAYPTDRSMLSWAWSFSLVIHGSAPNNDKVPKTARPIKKDDGQSAPPSGASSEADIDMLEGGERADDDQWLRVSEPHEIRQVASWINYEALLMDHQRELSEGIDEDDDEETTSSVKTVATLVERCNAFAEYVDLNVSEAETGERAAASKGRGRGGRVVYTFE